jgi:hypothetical protein
MDESSHKILTEPVGVLASFCGLLLYIGIYTTTNHRELKIYVIGMGEYGGE